MKKGQICFKMLCVLMAVSFFTGTIGMDVLSVRLAYAEGLNLTPVNQFIPLSDTYSFPILKGIKFDPANPLEMKFIIDTADKREVTKEEASTLIRYFLAALTIPEEEIWVNLSPYEEDKIIPEALSQTDLGKDLLSQDYLLKQLTSSLTYPESSTGKDYWDKTYAEVMKIAKTTKLPINTFNKIWIVPEHAQVYETGNTAFIAEAKLKAMLEEDYLALRNKQDSTDFKQEAKKYKMDEELVSEVNQAASKVMKEFILPKINQDVNDGKNFATLRQVYHSLILGIWFKKKFRDSIYSSYINQEKVNGIDLEDKTVKEKVYQHYVEAFKKGLYDYIKTEPQPKSSKRIKRRYYSGGIGRFGIPDEFLHVETRMSIASVEAMLNLIENNPMEVEVEVKAEENTLQEITSSPISEQVVKAYSKIIVDSVVAIRGLKSVAGMGDYFYSSLTQFDDTIYDAYYKIREKGPAGFLEGIRDVRGILSVSSKYFSSIRDDEKIKNPVPWFRVRALESAIEIIESSLLELEKLDEDVKEEAGQQSSSLITLQATVEWLETNFQNSESSDPFLKIIVLEEGTAIKKVDIIPPSEEIYTYAVRIPMGTLPAELLFTIRNYEGFSGSKFDNFRQKIEKKIKEIEAGEKAAQQSGPSINKEMRKLLDEYREIITPARNRIDKMRNKIGEISAGWNPELDKFYESLDKLSMGVIWFDNSSGSNFLDSIKEGIETLKKSLDFFSTYVQELEKHEFSVKQEMLAIYKQAPEDISAFLKKLEGLAKGVEKASQQSDSPITITLQETTEWMGKTLKTVSGFPFGIVKIVEKLDREIDLSISINSKIGAFIYSIQAIVQKDTNPIKLLKSILGNMDVMSLLMSGAKDVIEKKIKEIEKSEGKEQSDSPITVDKEMIESYERIISRLFSIEELELIEKTLSDAGYLNTSRFRNDILAVLHDKLGREVYVTQFLEDIEETKKILKSWLASFKKLRKEEEKFAPATIGALDKGILHINSSVLELDALVEDVKKDAPQSSLPINEQLSEEYQKIINSLKDAIRALTSKDIIVVEILFHRLNEYQIKYSQKEIALGKLLKSITKLKGDLNTSLIDIGKVLVGKSDGVRSEVTQSMINEAIKMVESSSQKLEALAERVEKEAGQQSDSPIPFADAKEILTSILSIMVLVDDKLKGEEIKLTINNDVSGAYIKSPYTSSLLSQRYLNSSNWL